MLKSIVGLALAGLLALSACAQAPHDHQHRFTGAERWARVFDDPARDEWQKPERVIEALKLAPDAAVADIGAGTGYFSVRLAQKMPKGRVYAVDVEPDMVKYVAARARRMQLDQVTAVQASANDAALPAPVDVVLLVNTYHHLSDREAYFRRLAQALKPGGRIAVVDFRMDAPVGPPPGGRVSADDVRREMQSAGYVLSDDHAFLPYQFFHIYRVR